MHQKEYLEWKLKQRGVVHGRPNLPGVEEGRDEPATQAITYTNEYTLRLNNGAGRNRVAAVAGAEHQTRYRGDNVHM